MSPRERILSAVLRIQALPRALFDGSHCVLDPESPGHTGVAVGVYSPQVWALSLPSWPPTPCTCEGIAVEKLLVFYP